MLACLSVNGMSGEKQKLYLYCICNVDSRLAQEAIKYDAKVNY